MSAQGRGAFTLVELLAVMAILAVLAGLFLPTLVRVKAAGHAVSCRANLKQWAMATHLYAADHDDCLPPDGTPNPGRAATNYGWYIQLPAQIALPRYHDMPWHTNASVPPGRSLWICPANGRRSNGRNLFHYCLNEHVNGTGAEDRTIRLSSVPQPSTLIWLFDTKNLPAVGGWSFVHTNLHDGGAHFAFLDGRVARHPRADYWDADGQKARLDHPDLQWTP